MSFVRNEFQVEVAEFCTVVKLPQNTAKYVITMSIMVRIQILCSLYSSTLFHMKYNAPARYV